MKKILDAELWKLHYILVEENVRDENYKDSVGLTQIIVFLICVKIYVHSYEVIDIINRVYHILSHCFEIPILFNQWALDMFDEESKNRGHSGNSFILLHRGNKG